MSNVGKRIRRKEYVSSQDSGFYFDNCPICRAMKKAEDEGRDLSMSELEEAFENAKDKGAIVGKSSEVKPVKA